MKLKVKTSYNENRNSFGYTMYEVVDELPMGGEIYKGETVCTIYDSVVDSGNGSLLGEYEFFDVVTVDDFENETTWHLAVETDLEREYYESMCGMYWDELEDEEQEHLMKSAKVLESHTTQAMKNAGICMIGFDYDLCTTGCTETDEDGNITFHVFEDAEIGTIPRRYIIK